MRATGGDRAPGAACLCALLAGLASLLVATPAAAQRPTPIFQIGNWDSRVSLDADFGRERTQRARGPFYLRRRLLQQRVSIRNTGLVFGRRWVVVRGGVTVAFQQANSVNTAGDSGSRGKVLNYDIGVDLMQTSDYQLSAGLARSNNNVDLRFGASSVTSTDTKNLTLRMPRLPLAPIISARRFHIDRASHSGNRVSRSIETRTVLAARASERWSWQSLSLSWSFDDVRNELTPGLSNPTHSATLMHHLRLPFLNSDGLQTNVQAFRRGGTNPLEQFDFSQNLRVQIFPSLSSTAAYSFAERHRQEQVFVTNNVSLGLMHQLYDSLSTNVSASASVNRLPSGRQRGYALSVGINYRKNIFGGGRLLGRYSRGYQWQDNAFDETQLDVVEERHEGRVGVPFQLLEPHVVPGSILVTDQSRVVIFEENVDYLVEYTGDLAEITITPEGRIADGEPLLIDYRVLTPARTLVESRRQTWSVSLDYGWIMPYFQMSRTRVSLLEGDDNGLLSPASNRSAGLRLRTTGQRLRLIASGQHEKVASRSSAFERLSFNEFVGYQFDNGATISLNLSQSRQVATIPERITRRALGRLTARWQLLPPLSVDVLMNARLWDDSNGRGETYYETGMGARWAYGRFEFYGTVRHFWTVRNGTPRAGLRATLKLSRSF